jgi:hypothetical protein
MKRKEYYNNEKSQSQKSWRKNKPGNRAYTGL